MTFDTPADSARAIHAMFKPTNAHEVMLLDQLVWAAYQLSTLLPQSYTQDEPDRDWLRFFTLADRVYQRNFRQLDKLCRIAEPISAEPPTQLEIPSTEVAPAAEPTAPPANERTPTTPRRRPEPQPVPNRRRQEVQARTAALLERLLQMSPPAPLLDVAITPTAA